MGRVARHRGMGLEPGCSCRASSRCLLLTAQHQQKKQPKLPGGIPPFQFCKKQPLKLLDFNRNGNGAVSVAKNASQNHRILGAGRDLWRPPGPAPPRPRSPGAGDTGTPSSLAGPLQAQVRRRCCNSTGAWHGGGGCSLIPGFLNILEKTAQRPRSLLHTQRPGRRFFLREAAEEEPQNWVTGFLQLWKTPPGNGKSVSVLLLHPIPAPTWKLVHHAPSARKRLRKPLWKFLLDFLGQLPSVSAEQAAVEVPGAQEQPWGDSVATERGPAWPSGPGEAQGALGFISLQVSLRRKRKTHESHVDVCKETSKDRVGFSGSQRDCALGHRS
ncbi:uncharacterized protein LOC121348524 [Pyrgilauda ruficollis]|uniref:uncharacterized protein LOC121348524 n=1 Tax=Pyrgilauda ruficollis TaxID=221976 RepID=UPI001B8649F0|nr:uncharacterized protein LOC121348524 [Pyrgilauda ruficollis]